jgi:hypothetical protein
MFEKRIYSRLYKHICTNNILVKEQYRFNINCSTEAASYNVIYEILKAMNNRLAVRGIFCGLEKAFCVNHGILLDKLEFYEVNGKFLTLINFISEKNTKQYSLIKLMFLLDIRSYE